ncbi:MAG: pyridine nucleotide-disulfide oxidoreductase/dicluster-binding protein [Coriobacteriales bacterium]|jgi:glutamate synthase (NADPH/NADH) small chain
MVQTAAWVVDHSNMCTADDPVPCTMRCPFGLDVRTIVGRVAKGEFDIARTFLEQHIPFPQFVCRLCSEPCRAECIRGGYGGSINMRALERACFDFGRETPARRYARRKKKGTIVVVGSGLTAMTCAYALGRKGYNVELRTSSSMLGGHLLQLPEDELPHAVLDAARKTVEENASVVYGSPFKSLDDFEWDALILATGAHSGDFGLATQGDYIKIDPITRETSRKGVFAAGRIVGEYDHVVAMGSALSVCLSVERMLRGGSLSIDRDDVPRECTNLHVDCSQVADIPAVEPADTFYTREEAIAEAQRCLMCECDFCVTTCDLMSRDRRKPKQCIHDLSETFAAVAKHSAKIALRKSNMCSQCGLCGERCPNGLNMGELYLEARRILRKRGELPPAFHDFWLRDMNHALGHRAAFQLVPEGGKPEYLYFPGCSLGASDPTLVTSSYELLQRIVGEENVALDVSCCGAPAHWSGGEGLFSIVQEGFHGRWVALGEPKVVVACPTCRKMLLRGNPRLDICSLWELAAEADLPAPEELFGNGEISLFDPCSARADAGSRLAIRKVLEKLGYKVDEMQGDGSEARCCGFGGLTYSADKDYTRSIADARLKSAEHDVVTYCSNCRDVFASHDARVLHILDVLMGRTEPTPRPSLSQRRTNRELLKAELSGEAMPAMRDLPPLTLDDGILAKLDDELLLVEEVQEAIASSYETGAQLLDDETGWIVTHKQVGIITIWVFFEPAPEGEGFLVHNVYSHRMKVEWEPR